MTHSGNDPLVYAMLCRGQNNGGIIRSRRDSYVSEFTLSRLRERAFEALPKYPKGETDVSVRLHIFSIAALVGVCSLASADDIQTHVTYVCNGEHLFVESCNVRDLSDNSTSLHLYGGTPGTR